MDSGTGTTVSRQSLDEVVDRLVSSYDTDYRGKATVAGEQTDVVDLSPANESVPGEMTVWLDTETYFPRQTVSLGDDTITTTYTNGTDRFFVVRRNSTASTGLDGGNVTVEGHEATLRDGPESGHVVTWTCDGKRYTVAGGLSEEATLAVAASIDCS